MHHPHSKRRIPRKHCCDSLLIRCKSQLVLHLYRQPKGTPLLHPFLTPTTHWSSCPADAVRGNSFALLSLPSVRSFRHVKAWIDKNSELNRERENSAVRIHKFCPKSANFLADQGINSDCREFHPTPLKSAELQRQSERVPQANRE